MLQRSLSFIGAFVLIAFAVFGSISAARAETWRHPALAGSPYDLVNAVNALRASYGLAPYNISPILMYTAQAQADFLAATGRMTHSGPGGINVTDRLLAAGYPLAGDLSLGGFRSENITGGSESMSAQAAVNSWTGDALHLTTMISPDLTEIGAGVAVNAGKVYYVIDCALPITGSAPQAVESPAEGGTAVPAATRDLAVTIPVTLSTPNEEGNVLHEVKPGQTLWQIAIAYGVKIDDIKSLNNLLDNNIYPGDRLLIRRAVASSTETPTETLTQVVISTSTSMLTPTSIAYVAPLPLTPVAVISSTPENNSLIMKVVMGAIAVGLLSGGVFAWLSEQGKRRRH